MSATSSTIDNTTKARPYLIDGRSICENNIGNGPVFSAVADFFAGLFAVRLHCKISTFSVLI
jgi:hypothetical protein